MAHLSELVSDCQRVDDGVDAQMSIAAITARGDIVRSHRSNDDARRGVDTALQHLMVSAGAKGSDHSLPHLLTRTIALRHTGLGNWHATV
jgi:hypothetical protein